MENETKTVFMADRVTIGGPRIDSSYRVSFEVGEYQYNNIKNLPLLNGKILVVAVVQGEELKKRNMENPAEEKETDIGGIKEIER